MLLFACYSSVNYRKVQHTVVQQIYTLTERLPSSLKQGDRDRQIVMVTRKAAMWHTETKTNWHFSTNLTEVFRAFFLSCKAHASYNSHSQRTARTIPTQGG
jgi:hypothetical protein